MNRFHKDKISLAWLLPFLIVIVMTTATMVVAVGPDKIQPPEKNRMIPDHAPTPFDADEIRKASPPGRLIKFHLRIKDKPDMFQVIRFMKGGGDEPSVMAATYDASGNQVGEADTSSGKWEDLQGHASFPKKFTQISRQSYSTKMGTFDCWHYIVKSDKEGKKEEKHLWFAVDLPGPPIYFEQKIDGEPVYRLTMVENKIEK